MTSGFSCVVVFNQHFAILVHLFRFERNLQVLLVIETAAINSTIHTLCIPSNLELPPSLK